MSNLKEDNKSIVHQLNNGGKESDAAFRRIFMTYYPRLQNFASRFIVDSDTVEDILQDVFEHLWQKRGTIADVSLQSMLFTMTRNSCLNFLRHDMLVNNYNASAKKRNAESERLYNYDMLGSADEPLLMDELLSKVNRSLEEMPNRTREVFMMSRWEGLKNREIAEKLGISQKVVEKHVSKALAALRKDLKIEKQKRNR